MGRDTSEEIAARYHRSTLKTGDIILSIVGTIGKVAMVPIPLYGGNITQSSVRIRPVPSGIIPTFLAWALRTPVLISQYDRRRLGTAVPRLNVQDVRLLAIPLPPVAEQQRIVTEIERRFSMADESEAQVEASLRRSEGLRQAILKRAFEGRLG